VIYPGGESFRNRKAFILYEATGETFSIKKDKKIPNECLWFYYGGNKKDFIIFV
jgi:hypothetical protein